MMIAVITYGTVLFALMISQWRGETVSLSVSVKERRKNIPWVCFILRIFRCVCIWRTCLFCVSVARHTQKECFCFWETWVIHILCESCLNINQYQNVNTRILSRRHFGHIICDDLQSYFRHNPWEGRYNCLCVIYFSWHITNICL